MKLDYLVNYAEKQNLDLELEAKLELDPVFSQTYNDIQMLRTCTLVGNYAELRKLSHIIIQDAYCGRSATVKGH